MPKPPTKKSVHKLVIVLPDKHGIIHRFVFNCGGHKFDHVEFTSFLAVRVYESKELHNITPETLARVFQQI